MSTLKNKSPYPFETIATAVGLSPTTRQILMETHRLCCIHNAKMIIIHVGKADRSIKLRFEEYLRELNIPVNFPTFIWTEGDVVDSILTECKKNIFDLLIIGALKQEGFMKKFFLQSTARELSRRAKCSILLLCPPKLNRINFDSILVNGVDHPKTEHTIETAKYIAEREGSKNITVINEVHIPSFHTIAEDYTKDEEDELIDDYIKKESLKCDSIMYKTQNNTPIEQKVILGKPGYTIAEHARNNNYDIMLINSPNKNFGLLDRMFPHEMEHILIDLPCNLLIVHSRGF